MKYFGHIKFVVYLNSKLTLCSVFYLPILLEMAQVGKSTI